MDANVVSFKESAEGKILLNTLLLENTRLLYDGISKLHRQLEPLRDEGTNFHARILGMQDIRAKIQACAGDTLTQAYSGGNPLFQNANISLCLFWQYFFKEEIVSQADIIGDMLLYYDLIQRLVNKQVQPDDMPYCYENLCWYFCNLMNCDMSYFIHREGCNPPQIICRSGYDIQELKEGRAPQGAEFAPLLRVPKTAEFITDDIWTLSFLKDEDRKKCGAVLFGHTYVVIRLDEHAELYLLLQYNDEKTANSTVNFLKGYLRLLFLREDLTECIRQDYHFLLNLRFDCGFVRFFETTADEENRYPVIMHIPDLHANETMSAYQKNVKSEFETQYEKYRLSRTPYQIDLLVLSGDIVDGKPANASQVQGNYQIAEKVLLDIVEILWKREDGRIPFDWKRRIICVPGNHDFAAMNLVKAALTQRRLAAGLPYEGENKVFAKFSYYLDFVQHFLDAPIDELVRNDINEVREYRNLKTKILMLNSSWGATAARTNKICLNEETVTRLCEERLWQGCDHVAEPYRICVLHHPNWFDYILDGYDIPEKWSWDPKPLASSINMLHRAFVEVVHAGVELDSSDSEENRKNFSNCKKVFLKEYEKKIKRITKMNILGDKEGKTYFTRDAELEYNYLTTEPSRKSEQISNLHNRMEYDRRVTSEDEKKYNEIMDAIEKTGVNVYLCGHIHDRNDVKTIKLAEKDIDNKRVIGGKFTDINSSGSVKTMSVQILSRGLDEIDIWDFKKKD